MWFDILLQMHEESARMSQYQILMLPKPELQQRKVLWFDFRKAVPEVAAEKPFGAAKTPQGEKDPWGRTMVAHSLKPASRKQVIWQPKHPEPIPEDIPAPNVADLSQEPVPTRKPTLKQFTPPPAARPKADPTLVVEPPPAVHSSIADLRDQRILRDLPQQGLELAQKPPLKQFVAPTSQPGTGSGPSKVIEPPSIPGLAGSGGSGQGVIVGLNPTDRFTVPVPEGSRSAEFSRSPTGGAPSSGSSSSPDAPRVPGVSARASSAQAIEANAVLAGRSVPARRILTEIIFPPMNRTMSAPLHPSSRIVPATVEARFAHRDVFALVMPGPKLPGYSGNWVVWFAPHQPEVASVSRILAPVPAGKEERSGDDASALDSAGKGIVQFEAVLDSRGRVLAPRVLNGPSSESFRRRALAELQTWEFKPTLRNGEPIDVDVVLEIPFEFRPPAAQTR
jgi:hypothetical protein